MSSKVDDSDNLPESPLAAGPKVSNIVVSRRDEFPDNMLLPRYKFIRYLGHGSYGHVASAEQVDTKKKVAIKKIPNIFHNLLDTKRILREVKILRLLHHPNVIKIVDMLMPDDITNFNELYIIFEFVDTDMERLIRSAQFFQNLHIQYMMYQMLLGVRCCHSGHIIHRDLKPANILVNEDCTIRICDFGLARGLDPENDDEEDLKASSNTSVKNPNVLSRQLTKHVVTRWYRAPEVILLQRDYNTAIDIWSCGCILAELLSMQAESMPTTDDREPLFPGSSCFPLTADNPSAYKNELDQLNVILDVIGTPSDEDINRVKHDKARMYLKGLANRPGVPLKDKYPGADPRAIDLLTKMLAFDPEKRLTAKEALKHPYFNEVRETQKEKDAKVNPIEVGIEDMKITKEALLESLAVEIKFYAHIRDVNKDAILSGLAANKK